MSRATLSLTSLVVIVAGALSFGSAASAQEERWHEQVITPLPDATVLEIDDLAFHDDVGYLAVRADNVGHVVRMAFPSDGPPAFSDTGYAGTHTYPFGVSFHGGFVSVTQETNQIGLFDVAAGTWDTAYAAPANGVVGVLEVDATGSARFLATPASLGSEANVYWYDGSVWVGHSAGGIETLHVALLASPWAVGVAESGRVYFTPDVAALPENGAWLELGVLIPALDHYPEHSSAAWLGAGAMAAVSASDTGSFALYVDGLDSGSPTLTDCTSDVVSVVPGGFRRVAAADGVLYALDRGGRVHRISSPDDCASWAEAPASSTPLNDAVGLGAVDGDIAVAVGLQGAANEPVVVWRNRAPALEAGPDVALSEESASTVTLSVSDPDPADAARLTVSVDCEPGVNASVSGFDVELSADATVLQCSAGSLLARCDVTASDGEKSAADTFTVTVARDDSEPLPPSPPSLERVGDEVVEVPVGSAGVDVTLAVEVSDACADDNTLRWDLTRLPALLWPEGASVVEQTVSVGRRELALSVPAESAGQLIGLEANVDVTVSALDEDVAGSVTFRLRFVQGQDVSEGASVLVDMSVAARRALAAGDVSLIDAQLSSSVPFALPALVVELIDGDLASIDGSVELSASSCGASGSVRRSGDSLVLEAEGVRAGCPLSFRFLARKGLAREALRVGRCTWGSDERELTDCSGELTLERPRTLGCSHMGVAASSSAASATTSSLLAFGFVAIAIGARRRRR